MDDSHSVMTPFEEYRVNASVTVTEDGKRWASQGVEQAELALHSFERSLVDEIRTYAVQYLGELCLAFTRTFSMEDVRSNAVAVLTAQIIAVAGQREIRVRVRLIGRLANNHRIETSTIARTGVTWRLIAENEVKALAATARAEFYDELDTRTALRGRHNVVLEPVAAGVLAHETWGHTLETFGDGKAEWVPMLGSRVANECISLIDDPTISGAWGSYEMDDVGCPASKTVLIENGLLVSSLTGNGHKRRHSWRHAPLNRMSNTFVLTSVPAGSDKSLFESAAMRIEKISRGSVEPRSGRFSFHVSKAYLLDGGLAIARLKPFLVHGSVKDVWHQAVAGNGDNILAPASCTKSGQRTWVGLGGAAVLMEGLNIA